MYNIKATQTIIAWIFFCKLDIKNNSLSKKKFKNIHVNEICMHLLISLQACLIANNSGTIEFNEFYALWQYVTDWQRTFRSYDKDNSGTIDRHELKTGVYNVLCLLCVQKMVEFEKRNQTISELKLDFGKFKVAIESLKMMILH